MQAIEAEAERLAGVSSKEEILSQEDIEIEAAFSKCLECHSNQTTSSSVPSLKGIYGRRAGSG